MRPGGAGGGVYCVGLEWHDRHRDKYGRFAADRVPALVQVHIRLTDKQARALRRAANEARETVKGYAARAVLARMAAEGKLPADDQDSAEALPGDG